MINRVGQRLLQLFEGASAAYSLRDLASNIASVVRVRRASDNSEKDFSAADVSSGAMTQWVNAQIVPPLDIRELDSNGERTGDLVEAAAAYSLRNLSASYTGNVVDVRRSSDDAEESFTAAEVADGTLTDWVNAVETVGAESNFSSTILPYNLYQADGSTASLNETIGGETGALKITSQGGSSHLRYLGNITNLSVNTTIKISIKVYIPSSNTSLDGLTFSLPYFTVTSGQLSNTIPTDTWTTVTVEGTSSNPSTSNSWRIYPRNRSAGDVIYLKNYRITQDIAHGHVTQWYDQSGNNNHATQSTFGSQPKIVDGGSLVSGGVDFDGVDDFLECSAFGVSGTTSRSTFHVLNRDVAGDNDVILGIGEDSTVSNGKKWHLTSTPSLLVFGGNEKYTSAPPSDVELFTNIFSGTNVTDNSFFLDGSEVTPVSSVSKTVNTDETVTRIGAGASGGSLHYHGKIAEFIIYNSDQSDNRTAFEANIGETYGIDLPSGVDTGYDQVDGFVETWYDQSSSVVTNYDPYPSSQFQASGNTSYWSATPTAGTDGTEWDLVSDLGNDSTNDFASLILASNYTASKVRVGKHRVEFNLTLNSGVIDNGASNLGDRPLVLVTRDHDNDPTTSAFSNFYEVVEGFNSIDVEVFDDGVEIAGLNFAPSIFLSARPSSVFDVTVSNLEVSHVTEPIVRNGNDAVQETASNQPKIVDAGVLVKRTINGVSSPSVKFTAGNVMTHGLTSLSTDGQQSLFFVSDNQLTSSTSTRLIEIMSNTADEARRRRPLIFRGNGGNLRFSVDTLSGLYITPSQTNFVSLYSSITEDSGGGTHIAYQDGSQFGSASVTLDANPNIDLNSRRFGNIASDELGAFFFTEVIYYPSDQSANRAAIETNINNQYDIY
jgi:hypothetical protein